MIADDEMYPDSFDPFGKEGEEYESIVGPGEMIETDEMPEEAPNLNEIERLALRKVCVDCQELMETVEATAAEIYNDPSKDNLDVRTWAKCPNCKKILTVV